jgi:hypothetical protein
MVLCGALFGMVVFYAFGFVIAAVLSSPKGIVPTIGETVSGALLGISVALPYGLISGIPLFIGKRQDPGSESDSTNT